MMIKSGLFRNLCSESILGFQFWSLFTGLFPMIWFYPLNKLDITGYEVFLGVLLVPIICEINIIANVIKSRVGLAVLRVISLAAITSFQAPSTYNRLVTISIGTAANILVLIATLSNNSPEQRALPIWGLLIGYFSSLVGRIWYTSIFPTWADASANAMFFSLGVVATADRILYTGENGKISSKKTDKQKADRSWFFPGLALGSFLFILCSIYGEVSVVSRWVVKGYPNTGPMPNPSGASVLFALFLGLKISIDRKRLTHMKSWWLMGSFGLFALYNFPTYLGFVGGVAAAVYLTSIAYTLIDQTFSHPSGRGLTVAMITFMIEVLFSIWTIAYNFVPGGVYTREHTGYVLFFVSLTWLWNLSGSAKQVKMPKVSKISTILFFLFGLGITGFIVRLQPTVYEHKIEPAKQGQISTLIWTFHFGFDNEGWPSLERAASLLNETGADVIALLESDASKPYLGNNDLAMWLSEKLNMYADFGPSTRDHTWGNLLLSKYPIVHSKHHLLPSPYGELAPGISATINVSGAMIDIVTSHMGNDRDVYDRKLQAEYLANLTSKSVNPVVLLAYVTSSPGSRDYQHFVSKGRLRDIDDTDRDRWCEYIMYRGLIRLGYARISHGGLSDTELQVAKFHIPKVGSKHWVDNDKIETEESKVPENQRFNPKFGSFRRGHNWVHSHQYHASTPKYFLPLKHEITQN